MDTKGRVIVPSRLRDVMRQAGEDTLMVSRMDGCLVAYMLKDWQQLEARILARADMSEGMRLFRRVFIGEACECACDCHADPSQCDGLQDVTDVVLVVNVSFRGAAAISAADSRPLPGSWTAGGALRTGAGDG